MSNLIVSGICRITRDAEARKSDKGGWYSFGIASFRKSAKEGKQSADFFDAEVFIKTEYAKTGETLKKGTLIFIENGYLRNDQFKGADGQMKNKFKILIMAFDVLADSSVSKPVETVKVQPPPSADSVHPTDLPPPMDYAKKKEPEPEFEEEVNLDAESAPF